MKHRTGVLPKDCKHISRPKIDREDLKELIRTILSAIAMVICICICFIAAAVAPSPSSNETITQKGGGRHDGSYPVAARRQSHP